MTQRFNKIHFAIGRRMRPLWSDMPLACGSLAHHFAREMLLKKVNVLHCNPFANLLRQRIAEDKKELVTRSLVYSVRHTQVVDVIVPAPFEPVER